MIELRHNLLLRRAQLRLTQDELAARTDTTRAVIADIEQGRGIPPPALLFRLADALGTTAVKLATPRPRGGKSDAEIAARRFDPPESFVNGRDFLAALAENYPDL